MLNKIPASRHVFTPASAGYPSVTTPCTSGLQRTMTVLAILCEDPWESTDAIWNEVRRRKCVAACSLREAPLRAASLMFHDGLRNHFERQAPVGAEAVGRAPLCGTWWRRRRPC